MELTPDQEVDDYLQRDLGIELSRQVPLGDDSIAALELQRHRFSQMLHERTEARHRKMLHVARTHMDTGLGDDASADDDVPGTPTAAFSEPARNLRPPNPNAKPVETTKAVL